MATYRKGFKKQTPEQLLLKVIVGIILTVLAIVLVAFIYDQLTVSRSYDDFTKIDAYENIFTQEDDSSVQIPDYLVYFYNDTCISCESIKQDALKLIEKAEKNGSVIFLVDTANMTDDDTFKDLFLTEVDEASMRTPMVVSVVDGQYEDKFIGTDDVLQVLNEVESGTYTPFN